MKIGLKLLLPILLFILIVIPVGIYSTILEDNNITNINTTLLNVPDVTMPNNFSSGPASLQAVLAYYGTDTFADQLINMTNTSENGTAPENIVQSASNLGFTADIKENMSLKDLQGNISQGKPVIVIITNGTSSNSTIQNMTNPQTEYHYLVVIGMDDQNVYFEDPALIGSRGFLPIQEFLDKWFNFVGNQTNTTLNVNNTNVTGNNSTVVVNNTLISHLGIIINGKPEIPSPFIKIL